MLGYFGAEMVDAVWRDGTAGSNVDGVWVPGSTTPVNIRIVAPQPMKADEMAKLPAGEHVSDYVVTWAETLALGTRDGLKDADTIEWDGKTYEVTQDSDRKVLGGFIRVVMKKVG